MSLVHNIRMNTPKGFGLVAALIVVAGLLILGGGAYVVLNPQAVGEAGDAYEQQADRKGPKWIELESSQLGAEKTSISWKFNDMDFDANNTPHTEVIVYVDGKEYVVGTFEGSCAEIGASGGVDGKGLLAGELSAAQCWFAGGGDEIGVFAHEDGGYQIMVGTLEEPIEGGAGFRGDFKIKTDIRL